MILGKIKKVHFVGIGGIGMSGIAELLLNLGFKVTGSDISPSDITGKLESRGATVFEGHDPKNVNDCDVLVYSSAIQGDNVELHAARDMNIPLIPRAEMLSELLKLKPTSVAVGGTHGKTTTTSMMGSVFTEANLDPTLVVGGVVKSLDINAILGSGDVIVAEADEYDRSFLKLKPTYSVITSIDTDHMECYDSQDDLLGAFIQFANAVPFYGSVVTCLDEPFIRQILPEISRPVTTYGFSEKANVRAENMKYREMHSEFTVSENGTILGTVHLNVPGAHNVKNALAVVALALELNIDFGIVQRALGDFTGVRRRFEVKGVFNDIMVVDDYAHHPTEVSATLKAIKNGWNRRLVSVFQPHLFTRTRDFYEDFAKSFLLSDVVVVTEVYPAREDPIEGVSGELIVNVARSLGHEKAYWVERQENIVEKLKESVQPGDLVITLGAGDIWRVCDQYIQTLQEEKVTT